MTFLTIFLIAISLAMDAFAVSVSCGLQLTINKLRKALRASFMFGLFQGIMPVIGWGLGTSFKNLVAHVDHWIAFSLLAIIGGKMIYEGTKPEAEACPKEYADSLKTLFLLAVATSIDALIVGFGFSFLIESIVGPAIVIAVVTFTISLLGHLIGHKIGNLIGKRAEVLGGMILIGIGAKILIEHLSG